jgi:pyruvate formate lyase activating enzyme
MQEENEIKGRIFDIKRFAVHDGPGIRTTVFLKGCSLHCAWCHNPEAIRARPEVAFYSQRCIDCGACVDACAHGAREETAQGQGIYHRDEGVVCGECVEVCYAEALVLHGREVCVAEVFEEVCKDAAFYKESGGGITLSGGEPLQQAVFATALLKAFKQAGYHTALDTCGMVRWSAFEKALPYVDMVLYDIKHMDPERHKEYTGASNVQILDNLSKLNALQISVEIRMPIIPGINDGRETIEAAAELLAVFKSVTGVRILPYHRLAGEKYISLGYENTMPVVDPPDDEKMGEIAGWIRGYGLEVIA